MNDKKLAWIRWALPLVFLIIGIVVFASLAEDVVHHEELSTLDPILGNVIITHSSTGGDRVASMITFWGNGLVITVGTVLLSLWLSRSKRWNQVIFLDTAVGGAGILNLLLKQVFVRPRPAYPHTYLTETGFSFPSGHAMLSVAFFGAVAYLSYAYLKSFRMKLLVTIAALVISGLIGYSRLYLGVHYLSDVLAGWAAGGFWLAVCIFVDQLYIQLKKPRKRPYSDSRSLRQQA